MQSSPYTPGTVAKTVPGRRAQLAFYEERAQHIALLHAFAARVRVDVAGRGIGKTSLLREAQRIFERHGIRSVWVTADPDESLAAAILAELRHIVPKDRSSALVEAIDSASLTIGPSFAKASATIKPDRSAKTQTVEGEAAAKVFQRALRRAVDAVVDDGGAGLVILVDEVQAADKPSLRTIAHAWQELSSDPEPLRAGLFTAGLPGAQERINTAATFSERFDVVELHGIDDASTADALVTPARTLGVVWDPAAVRLAVDAAGGYPYKVQLIGEAAWIAAGRPDPGARIAKAHVAEGMADVDRQMSALFQARWRNASVKQRELLLAIAELGGRDVKREDIAAQLGVPTTKISMARDGLLRKGILDASRYGHLSIQVPGFADFILARRE